MLFSSMEFIFIFLPVCISVNLLLRGRARNYWLLLCSLLFYAWGEPSFVFVMIGSIALNYGMALLIERCGNRSGWKKMLLTADIACNLSVLFIFKYLNFFTRTVRGWFPGLVPLIPQTSILLPVGISFFTFQALSYVIDVYRGTKAQKNPFYLGLYISLFPQLIAGPIVRYGTIANQIENRKITVDGFSEGVLTLIRGFNKKILLANVLAEVADYAFGTAGITVGMAWLGALCYMLQIYYDFGGYSDMAIGLGRLLGFTFSENFDHPYTAVSVTDFWRRWHISLSSWFREYVYIPLGGNRVSTGRHIRNLLIVWMLTGLWHGASLNFILWGLYYGIWLILEKYVLGDFLRKHLIAGRIYTLMIVVLGWMLFAITDFKALGMYLRAMFGMGAGAADHRSFAYLMSYGIVLLAGAVCSAGWPGKQLGTLCRKHERVLAGILAAAFVLCLASLAYDSFNPFLYFRF